MISYHPEIVEKAGIEGKRILAKWSKSTRGPKKLRYTIFYINRKLSKIDSGDPFEPYKRLWAEVLIQACKDILLKPRHSRHYAAKNHAQQWFHFDDDDMGSYKFTCELLGIDGRFIKEQLGI